MITIEAHEAEASWTVTFEPHDWSIIEEASIVCGISHLEAIRVAITEGIRHLADLAKLT